jgi:peptidoglycan/LPS O-acetylase OafA/YrhL
MADSAGVQRRFTGLDLFKGLLVLIMVIYHAGSSGLASFPELSVFCNRVDPVHYAFLFLSGFLAGWHYAPRLADDAQAVRARLFKRTLKLALVCLSSTALLYALGFQYDWGTLADAFQAPLVTLSQLLLNLNGKLIAFEVLLYISFFLALAAMLLGRIPTWAVASLVPLLLLLRPWALNAYFVAFGFAGLVAGLLWENMKEYRRSWGAAACAGSVAMVILVQVFFDEWTRFQILSGPAKGGLALLVICSWAGCAAALQRWNPLVRLNKWLVLLGRHTLFGYMLQMALVHLAQPVLKGFGGTGTMHYWATVLLATLTLTIALALLDRARVRSGLVAAAYRAVFG